MTKATRPWRDPQPTKVILSRIVLRNALVESSYRYWSRGKKIHPNASTAGGITHPSSLQTSVSPCCSASILFFNSPVPFRTRKQLAMVSTVDPMHDSCSPFPPLPPTPGPSLFAKCVIMYAPMCVPRPQASKNMRTLKRSMWSWAKTDHSCRPNDVIDHKVRLPGCLTDGTQPHAKEHCWHQCWPPRVLPLRLCEICRIATQSVTAEWSAKKLTEIIIIILFLFLLLLL
jgi:hypothetical protein